MEATSAFEINDFGAQDGLFRDSYPGGQGAGSPPAHGYRVSPSQMTPLSETALASIRQSHRDLEMAQFTAQSSRLSPVKRPEMSTKRRSPYGLVSPLQRKLYIPERPPREEIYARTAELLWSGARRCANDEEDTMASDGLLCQAGCGGVTTSCSFCDSACCPECSRECCRCHESFCSLSCTVLNYDQRWERVFCLNCLEEESTGTSGMEPVVPQQQRSQPQVRFEDTFSVLAGEGQAHWAGGIEDFDIEGHDESDMDGVADSLYG